MSEPRVDTFTFLFTDIEDSSRLWETDPHIMAEALRRHDGFLRRAIEAGGGTVFKTTGDGMLAVFPSVLKALKAALQAQRDLGDGCIRVRMAVHTGKAEQRDGDYFGPPLNRVARILDAGWGGQVLLSGVAAGALSELSEGASLEDLGSHRLRDLSQPEHLFQIRHPDLPRHFPPLRTLGTHPHNLPVQLTSLVGREQELIEVGKLLSETRLLTLTGVGGTGKTRLGLQAAAVALGGYRDGTWLCELGPLTDPDLLPQAVALALRLREQPGRPLSDTLVDYLAAKELLLVLDNCEHLLDGSAFLANLLLRQCPGLRILATSREALGVPGEVSYPVTSLDDRSSERLFLERARAVATGFSPIGKQAQAVAQICRRLDGIPLAIELAAARIRVLSPYQIAARLDDRFRLLTAGPRTALPRQRTLEATIDWSHRLLSEEEKTLFRRLSVFSGGFTLEASEAVGEGQGSELLFHLVDKSLVVTETERYRLLETIRQFAAERLAESGEADSVRRRHAEFFLGLAEDAEPNERGANDPAWAGRLEADHDNFRASLAWCLDAGQGELGLRLVGSIFVLWAAHGHAVEGSGWAVRMLKAAADAPDDIRAKATIASAWMALHQGHEREGIPLAEEGLTLARRAGNEVLEAWALMARGYCRGVDPERAKRALAESLAIYVRCDDQYGAARALYGLALLHDFEQAGVCLERALEIFRKLRSTWYIAWTLGNLCMVDWGRGRLQEARRRGEEALVLIRETGDRRGTSYSLIHLGTLVRVLGDLPAARELLREGLTISADLGLDNGILRGIEAVAAQAVAEGDLPRAARLYGVAEVLQERLGISWHPIEETEYFRSKKELENQFDPQELARTWEEGRSISLDEAIPYALEDSNATD